VSGAPARIDPQTEFFEWNEIEATSGLRWLGLEVHRHAAQA
jgi:hypothetical protein